MCMDDLNGGTLARIDDSADEQYIWWVHQCNSSRAQLYRRQFYNVTREFFWIGLSDSVQEGIFLWEDGGILSYSNWARGRPSTVNGGVNSAQSNCVVYNGSGWLLANCVTPLFNYLCEAPSKCWEEQLALLHVLFYSVWVCWWYCMCTTVSTTDCLLWRCVIIHTPNYCCSNNNITTVDSYHHNCVICCLQEIQWSFCEIPLLLLPCQPRWSTVTTAGEPTAPSWIISTQTAIQCQPISQWTHQR